MFRTIKITMTVMCLSVATLAAVPEGLTDSDWNGIRQEYERHRHAAVAVDGEFRARNPVLPHFW